MVTAPERETALTPRRTTIASIAAATLLVALKLGVGVATGSLGLISAGIESSGDVIAATLTFFAVRLGGRPADPEHPYGHRRAENLGALGEAAILLAGGILVSVAGIRNLINGAAPPSVRWYQFAVIARGAARRRQPGQRLAARGAALRKPRAALQRAALRGRHDGLDRRAGRA